MGSSMVDGRQGISFELEIRLETMENNHEELKSMQNTLVQNQTRMSNMLEELLAFMKVGGGSKDLFYWGALAIMLLPNN
jgi:hypothetical protein